jgi:two-component system OmpR family response regulator
MWTINYHDLGETAHTPVYHPMAPQYPVKTKNNNDYTILIVDDTQSSRELVYLYLKTLGYNVLLAENGVQALQLVAMHSVDLVLLDIMLPNMDGLAVCAAIREHSEIPIIMLTALSELDYTARAFQVGADGYITKPFSLSTLKMRLQDLLHD